MLVPFLPCAHSQAQGVRLRLAGPDFAPAVKKGPFGDRETGAKEGPAPRFSADILGQRRRTTTIQQHLTKAASPAFGVGNPKACCSLV